MANGNGQDPNAQQQPVIGQVQGGRLFEDDVEDYGEDWGEVYGQDSQQKVPDDGGQTQGAPEVSELKGQLAQMQKTIEQQQQQLMAMMQQPAQTQQPQQAPQQQQEQEEELPDPFDDPKGYAATVERNVRRRLEAEKEQESQQAQQQQTEQQKYAELWNDFTIKHKDYAEDPDRVQFAANKVAQRASKRGLDLNRYMFVHRDQFMSDVVEEMDRIFGGKQQGQGDSQQQQTPQFVPDQGQAGHDPGRTQGMFGGQAQGNRPAAAESEDNSDPFSDIREFQKRTGFHR